jgi:para-nitrobenzyl esterase
MSIRAFVRDISGLPDQTQTCFQCRRSANPTRAVHSAEIQCAIGNLDLDPHYLWGPDDRKVSQTTQGLLPNFIKTGNPDGRGLPNWPAYDAKPGIYGCALTSGTETEPQAQPVLADGRDRCSEAVERPRGANLSFHG